MTDFFAVEYSFAGCAPLDGAAPVFLGAAETETAAVLMACQLLTATVLHRSVIKSNDRRWLIVNRDELNTFF